MKCSRSVSWLVAAVSAVACIPSLAACSSGPSENGGRLSGVVYTKGGENAETNPAEAKVTATPTQGNTTHTYTAETANDGSYSLDLPAGTYELTGTLTTRIPGGLTTPEEVTIAPGETTTMDLFAIYP